MRSSRRSWPSRRSAVGLVPGLAIVLVAGLAMAACGGAASPSAAAEPTVSDAWVRLPTGMGDATAAYLTITGGSEADSLTAAASGIATMVGLHQSTTDSAGMTGMHPVDSIDIPAGATVKLEPGGYHVMLEGLTQALTVGEKVQIELTFEHAGKVVVEAEVRAG